MHACMHGCCLFTVVYEEEGGLSMNWQHIAARRCGGVVESITEQQATILFRIERFL